MGTADRLLAPGVLPDALDRQLWRADRLAPAPVQAVASGFAALDAQLPGGGWPVGCLTELIAREPGVGELRLLVPLVARLTRQRRLVILLAPPHVPYAPALADFGIDLDWLVVVHAPQAADRLWAIEQAIRSQAFGAVLAWLPDPAIAPARGQATPAIPGRPTATRPEPADMGRCIADGGAWPPGSGIPAGAWNRGSWRRGDSAPVTRPEHLRRLQLAAQGARGPVIAFRGLVAQHDASPAPLRLLLQPHPDRRLSVTLLKRRGPVLAQPLLLSLPQPPHAVRLRPRPQVVPAVPGPVGVGARTQAQTLARAYPRLH